MLEDHTIACASCPVCDGTGYQGADLCECLLAHRVRVFMTHGGFSSAILDFVSDADYQTPFLDAGDEHLAQYVADPERDIDRGLSLYIFSREAGRGKTVLAYYIVRCLTQYFARTQNYRPKMSFAFQTANAFLSNSTAYTDEGLWQSTVYVLDDVGNEKRSNKQRRDAMAPALQELLQYRRNEQLPTIFTSNYTPATLGALYEGRIDSLLEIGVDGVIHGDRFRQIEVGGGEDLRTLNSSWDS